MDHEKRKVMANHMSIYLKDVLGIEIDKVHLLTAIVDYFNEELETQIKESQKAQIQNNNK